MEPVRGPLPPSLGSRTGGHPVLPPTVASAPPKVARRGVPTWLVVLLSCLLLAVAAVQTALLLKLTDRVDKQSSQLASARRQVQELQQQGRDLSDRTLRLEDKTSGSLNAREVADKVLPSVFRVRAGQSLGTAFAFGPRRSGSTLLITNFHVVEESVRGDDNTVVVEHQNRSFEARIRKTDQERDLALLEISRAFTPLRASTNAVSAGDPVVVVGAPLGLSDTVTTGVVSAVRDQLEGLNTPVIQFDAAISPGNSGGPVVDATGSVVGIAQAKITDNDADGLALAIPIDQVCRALLDCE